MQWVGGSEFEHDATILRNRDPLIESSQRLSQVKSDLLQSRFLVIGTSHSVQDPSDSSGTPGLSKKLKPSERSGTLGRFGSFEVLRLLGSGGMGAVYEATSSEYPQPIAIKVLLPHASRDKQSRARFLREAKHLSVIDHENVVRILAAHEIEKTPCIVMERVLGRSLQLTIDQDGSPLNGESLQRIALQTAKALLAAHERGILHRDVKPANIMLEDGTGRIRLTDFGLAKAMHDVGLTASNAVPGTPEYMSPEQLIGNQVDFRSDLFSLGTSLYFAATSRNPFSDNNLLQVFRNVASLEPASLHEVAPKLNPSLSALVMKLMQKEIDKRPASAAELLNDLMSI
ncbi:Serine/threonine-protein kinase PknB [Rubripirellula tenax]|uniref:Serine/threonine-protein kinase PknB n=2 Tax=Rubripirellula tenax TaxID=2528015 RepID=A0A5C6EAF4_9BACT|nr:Serine/threonine-protein kinase PknB [Rubripirellula tenax]